jgi:ATP-dependent helicase/nuclease subunit A
VKLSAQQRRAVERTGQDVCVVAGPGSGKTRTLVARFAWLVENGTEPARILAVTFTEKAAREIKQRLMLAFRERADLRSKIELAPVSTLHGFCARLLREHAVEAGLDPEFRILEERQADAEQHESIEAALDRAAVERREEFRRLIDAWRTDKPAGELLSVYEALRIGRWGGRIELPVADDPKPLLARVLDVARAGADSVGAGEKETVRQRAGLLREWAERAAQGGDPLEWLAGALPDRRAKHAAMNQAIQELKDLLIPEARRAVIAAGCAPCRETVRRILLDFHETYTRSKTQRSELDFNDLEEKAIELLEKNRRLREDVQNSYDAILMDELQDTNPVQWQLMSLLRRPDRFFAVGDVNQSIYGFRHADPRLMQEYERSLAAGGQEVDRLEENYRSRAVVLQAVESVSQGAAGIQAHSLKALGSLADKPGPEVEILIAEEGASEAEWIARRIRDLAAEGYRYRDMLVLARKKTMFAEIEEALIKFDIRCQADRGKNFFDEPEIVDLTNWLRVLDEPADAIAAVALLRSPFYAVSDEELFRQRLDGRVAPPEVEAEWTRLRRVRADRPMDQLLAQKIDETGYAGSLGRGGPANIDKFFSLLRGWAAEWPGDLRQWIRTIDELRDLGQEPAAPAVEAGEAVRVMSIHGAKGLEAPVVFVCYLHLQAGGRAPALAWSEEAGLGFLWRDPADGGTSPDSAYLRIVDDKKAREAEESDRLLYVAMTRAMDRLTLSWKDTGRRGSVWPERIAAALGARAVRVATAPETPEWSSAQQEAEVLELAPLKVPPGPASDYTVTQVLYGNDVGWPDTAAENRLGTEVHEILARGSVDGASSEAADLAQRFWKGPLGRRAAQARRAEREYDFVFAEGGIVYRGQIDLWFEDAGGLVLVDYKTDRRVSPARLERYTRQVQLYALGLDKKPAEAYLALLAENRVVEIDVSERALNSARALLAAWRG